MPSGNDQFVHRGLFLYQAMEEAGLREQADDFMRLEKYTKTMEQTVDGGYTFVHPVSGKRLDVLEWLKGDAKLENPHWYPTPASADDAHLAFVQGNVTARGRLMTSLGKHDYEQLAKSYGVTGYDTKLGTAPAFAPGVDQPAAKPIPSNPFSRDHFNLTEQAKYIKQHGQERALAAARQAGLRFIGDTHSSAAKKRLAGGGR